MFKFEITKEWLSEKRACPDGVEWFEGQKESAALTVLQKLRSKNKWNWFKWLTARLMTHHQRVEWAIFVAEQVIDIFEKKNPKNDRPRKAIEAARAFLKGKATKEECHAAASAASAAAAAADADASAYAAAYAAYTAADAAYYVAYYADAREKFRNILADKAIEILNRKTHEA